MIWAAWFLLSLVAALLASKEHRAALMLVCLHLIAVQIGKGAADPVAQWYFSAMCSVVAGLAISRLGGGKLALPALLMVASGIAVIAARFIGGAYAFGNPYLALSDLCGAGAIVLLGAPGAADFGGRVANRWRGAGRGGFVNRGDRGKVASKAFGEAQRLAGLTWGQSHERRRLG
jgi:hypothetical protein